MQNDREIKRKKENKIQIDLTYVVHILVMMAYRGRGV